MAAVMLVGMSTEIVPIAYHINLSVLTGIVLGPAYGLLVAFIVNLILAMFGHGGITVVGLNTPVLGAEIALGSVLFRLLLAALRRLRPALAPALAAGLTTGLTLFVTTWLLIGVVWIASVDPGDARHTGPLDPGTLSFANPLDSGLIANRLIAPEAEEEHGHGASMDMGTFARAVLLLGLVGWILEGAIIAAIVGFVYRVRPDLIRGRPRELKLAAR
jgi:cobalt/nickel transport system permease protein